MIYKHLRSKKIITLILLLAIIIPFILIGLNNKLGLTYYTYQDKNLPKEFDGFRIAFISDFHCKKEGKNEKDLLSLIDSFNPDLVVFTGDMIDGNHKKIATMEELLEGLAGKYSMYAVGGNHEKDIMDNYVKLMDLYKEYGVVYLEDTSDIITKNGASIGICGKYFRSYWLKSMITGSVDNGLKFNILLYHDATSFPVISSFGYNLIFAGHTHGGIIRLPLIGGLISTKKTFFAKYAGGIYQKNGSTMISSRGIGDAFLPRFYNNSELLGITLKTK